MTRGNGMEFRGEPKAQLYDRISKNPISGCWNWIGNFYGTGYGQFKNKVINAKPIHAHRASWIIHNGPIPKGAMVLHDCDNRRCVNPEHLHLGDNKINMIERSQRGYVHQRALDESKIREMRQLRQQGWGWMKLAKRYGVAQNAIIEATMGKSWAWIDEPIPTYVGITGRNNETRLGKGKYGPGISVYHDKRDGRFYARHVGKSLGGFSTLADAEIKIREFLAEL
jgi:hypothetical protein